MTHQPTVVEQPTGFKDPKPEREQNFESHYSLHSSPQCTRPKYFQFPFFLSLATQATEPVRGGDEASKAASWPLRCVHGCVLCVFVNVNARWSPRRASGGLSHENPVVCGQGGPGAGQDDGHGPLLHPFHLLGQTCHERVGKGAPIHKNMACFEPWSFGLRDRT